jgi:DNA polymerase IV
VTTPARGTTRRILLADADAFFVGVARLVDPEGAGRAPRVIVGGRPGGRGVVCSASYEARALGVRSAMPIRTALRLCPDALCVPVPTECREYSRAIRAELERWAPLVEAASIDEWFLDLSGTEALYRTPFADTAHAIRTAVHAATGLTVSIGGGPSKFIAKLAVELAKPGRGGSGVHLVEPDAVRAFLDPLPVAAVPGIGPRAEQSLHRTSIRTLGDARLAPSTVLVAALGPRGAQWLTRRAQGIDDRPVLPRAARKQISHERTFGRDLSDDTVLRRRLLALVARTGADLRAAGLRARTVTVKLRDARFRTRSMALTLRRPVESDAAIRRTTMQLFEALRPRVPGALRLAGVAVSGFDERGQAPEQLGLFAADPPPDESPRDIALARALDRVRARFGPAALHQGEHSE